MKMMKRQYAIWSCLGLLLFAMGCTSSGGSVEDEQISDRAVTESEEPSVELVDSEIIPVGESPVKGADDAWTTVVVFADFQCPFCARLAATLDQVTDVFDDEQVRVVFKHFPLDGNAETSLAAIAAEAAGEQGKFWEMHDALFDEFNRLSRGQEQEVIAELVTELELDEEQFHRDIESPEILERIDDDQELAVDLGVRSVPAVFINGVFISGAQPGDTYQGVIASLYEILRANVEAGEVEREEIYRASVETLFPQTRPQKESSEPAEPSVEEVPIAGDRRSTVDIDEATVHIGAFLSFGDDPSLQVQRQLDELLSSRDDVRVIYFHIIHDDEESTRLAHRAIEGARSSEELRLLATWLSDGDNGWKTDPDLLREFLDDREIVAVDDDALEQVLSADLDVARDVGVYGTPTMFINGIPLVGTPEPQELAEIVDEQRALAERVGEVKEIDGEKLYEEMVAGNKER